jgi:hypothetical protein
MGTTAEDDVASTMVRDEGPRDGRRRLLSSSRELRQAGSRPHGSGSLLPGRGGHQHVPLAACGLLAGGARKGGWGRRDAVELSPRPARHQGVRGAHAGGGLAAEEPSTELAHGFRAATFWPPRAGLGFHAGRGRKQHGRRSQRGEDSRRQGWAARCRAATGKPAGKDRNGGSDGREMWIRTKLSSGIRYLWWAASFLCGGEHTTCPSDFFP